MSSLKTLIVPVQDEILKKIQKDEFGSNLNKASLKKYVEGEWREGPYQPEQKGTALLSYCIVEGNKVEPIYGRLIRSFDDYRMGLAYLRLANDEDNICIS